MTTITLYGKAGCCLCDDARRDLEALREQRPFELQEIDVSLDPRLHAEYGERIPVIAVEGEEVSELGVDTTATLARLDNLDR